MSESVPFLTFACAIYLSSTPLLSVALLLIGLLSESVAHASRVHREAVEAKEAERSRIKVSLGAMYTVIIGKTIPALSCRTVIGIYGVYLEQQP